MLTKKEQRLRRARQTRIRIATQGIARLTVNRTNLHIYASLISDDGSKVLATASTVEADIRKELYLGMVRSHHDDVAWPQRAGGSAAGQRNA